MARLGINGLLHITGEQDCGKTSFALECGALPSRIILIDNDVKGRTTVEQLRSSGVEFGAYHDMIAKTKGMREVQIFDVYMKIFQDIKPNQFDAMIIDTWTEFENSIKPVVSKDPKKYREFYSPMGVMKAGEEWQVSFDYEAEILSDLLIKIPLVIVVTHLKGYNVGSKRVEGKFVPACKVPLVTKSFFRLWLRRNPASPVPLALVLKRLNKKYIDEQGRIRTLNVLPLKIVPGPDDLSLWDTIERHWNNPVGNAKPRPEEVPDEDELSILEGTLTQDQKLALNLAFLEAQEESAALRDASKNANSEGFSLPPKETVAPIAEDEVAKVLAVREKPVKEIVAETGVAMPRVLKILKENPTNEQ